MALRRKSIDGGASETGDNDMIKRRQLVRPRKAIITQGIELFSNIYDSLEGVVGRKETKEAHNGSVN